MVRIEISDLQPSANEQVFNEITDREMKTVEGGVVTRRPIGYPVETEEPVSTDTTVSGTLRQVNSLLDNLRLELDKLFGRLG